MSDQPADFIRSQGSIWVAHIMRRVASRIVDASDEVLSDYGVIVPSKMASVVHLLHTQGPQTVMAIATRTGQSHPLIHKYVQQLKSLKLVTSRDGDADRRQTFVTLTAAGQLQARRLVVARTHIVPALEKLMMEADAQVFEPLWRIEAALQDKSMTARIRAEQRAQRLDQDDLK